MSSLIIQGTTARRVSVSEAHDLRPRQNSGRRPFFSAVPGRIPVVSNKRDALRPLILVPGAVDSRGYRLGFRGTTLAQKN